jgi:hypothetical protein
VAGAAGAAVAGCAGGTPPTADPASQSGDLQWLIAAHTPETQDWLQNTFVPGYQAARPRANVTMSYVSWDELFAKRGALFAAGSGPDVLQAGGDDTVEYVRSRFTVDLKDRLARWPDWADFYDVPKAATTYEGHVTGIPAQLDTAIKRVPETVDRLLVRPPLKKEKQLSFFSTNYCRPHPPIVNFGEVNRLMPAVLKDVREGHKSPKDGVEELARGMQQIFDDFLAR